MKVLREILCILFGLLFVYSGLMKAWRPILFLDSVRSFEMLPDPYAACLALFLPWLEIFAGVSVATAFGRRGGLLVLNAGLVIFLAAILTAWARGTEVSCGCFGESRGTSNYLWLIARDVTLLGWGALLAWRCSPKNSET